jgi:hypothetical protein
MTARRAVLLMLVSDAVVIAVAVLLALGIGR